MPKSNVALFLFCFLCNQSLLFAQNKSELSYTDVIDLTLKNNKDIIVSAYEIEWAKGVIISSKGDFNTELNGSVNQINNNYPYAYNIRKGLNGQTPAESWNNQYSEFAFSARKRTSWGTQIEPGLILNAFGKDSLYDYLIENGEKGLYTSKASAFLKINQPLYREFGKTYNLFELRKAEQQYKISELKYLNSIAYTVLNSLQEYLNLIYTNKYYDLQVETFDRYKTLHDQLKYLIDMDAIPKADLTYVKAIMETQQANIEAAKLALNNSLEQLGLALGLSYSQMQNLSKPPNEFMTNSIRIVFDSDYLVKCIANANTNRFDLQIFQNQLEINTLILNQHKNLKKAKVDLNLELGYNGIYESNSFDRYYQPFLNNIPGLNYRVGISYFVTPKNSRQEGELIQTLAQKEQIEILKNKKLDEIGSQIRDNYNNIILYNKILQNNNQAVSYVKEALESEYTKLKLGTSTVLNLVQLQLDYNVLLSKHYDMLLNINQEIIKFRYYSGQLVNVDEANNLIIDYINLFSLPNLN